jgi:hypothetical protein
VTLYRTSDVPSNYGDDLVIVLDNGQDQLHVAGFFDGAYTNCISQIEFATGTVLNTATILANVINVGGVANDQTGTSANNTFTVDHWGDSVQGLGGVDTISSSVSFTLGSDVENLTLTGVLDINASSNSGSNVLTGNAGANVHIRCISQQVSVVLVKD